LFHHLSIRPLLIMTVIYIHELLPPLQMGSPRAVKLSLPACYLPGNRKRAQGMNIRKKGDSGSNFGRPCAGYPRLSWGLVGRQLSYRPYGIDQKVVSSLLSTTLVAFPRAYAPRLPSPVPLSALTAGQRGALCPPCPYSAFFPPSSVAPCLRFWRWLIGICMP